MDTFEGDIVFEDNLFNSAWHCGVFCGETEQKKFDLYVFLGVSFLVPCLQMGCVNTLTKTAPGSETLPQIYGFGMKIVIRAGMSAQS